MSTRRLVSAAVLATFIGLAGHGAAKSAEGGFQSSGLTLHYTVSGQGDPVVVLAGGPGFGASYMQPVVDMISRDHTAILLEQRGTGRSSPTPETADNVNEDLVVADLEALRSRLGYRRWTLLGHSFGTMTAMRYAFAYPDRVRGMILLAVMAPRKADDHMGANLGRRLPYSAGPTFGKLMAEYNAAKTPPERNEISGRMSALVLPAYLYDPSKAPAMLQVSKTAGLNADTGDLIVKSVGDYDLVAGLGKLKIPTLIVQGEADPLDPSMAGKTRDAIPGAKLVVLEHCGHFAWIEAPDRLASELKRFLADK